MTTTADRRAQAAPTRHVCSPECAVRTALGLAALVAGLALFAGAGSSLRVAVGAVLVMAGFDVLITGVTGRDPVPRRPRHQPVQRGR